MIAKLSAAMVALTFGLAAYAGPGTGIGGNLHMFDGTNLDLLLNPDLNDWGAFLKQKPSLLPLNPNSADVPFLGKQNWEKSQELMKQFVDPALKPRNFINKAKPDLGFEFNGFEIDGFDNGIGKHFDSIRGSGAGNNMFDRLGGSGQGGNTFEKVAMMAAEAQPSLANDIIAAEWAKPAELTVDDMDDTHLWLRYKYTYETGEMEEVPVEFSDVEIEDINPAILQAIDKNLLEEYSDIWTKIQYSK